MADQIAVVQFTTRSTTGTQNVTSPDITEDMKALIGRGHDIKGMTSNFGLTALSDLGARLERQAKENFPLDALADIVKKLRPTYYDTRSIVDKWMKVN